MDYNYVRMRNAIKNGDESAAAHYRHLYETGTEKTHAISALDWVIAILLVISLLLSVYILYSEQRISESDINRTVLSETTTDINEVQK